MSRSFKSIDGLLASIDCSSWSDFREKVIDLLSECEGDPDKRYIFRGQSCSSWGLDSNFDRKFSKLTPAECDVEYKRRMALFIDNFKLYGNLSRGSRNIQLPANLEGLGETSVEALAQHYGMSTRLLDWSGSAYVAAFFAFSNSQASETGMVSVWTLDCSAFSQFSSDHLSYVEDKYEENTRNIVQDGCFTRNRTNFRDTVDLFRANSGFTNVPHGADPLLVRFDIPVSEKSIAVRDLELMRINSMSIFPGIEGVIGWIESGG